MKDSKLAAAHGFTLQHQGGGIHALQKNIPDGRFILITEEEDEARGTEWVVGLHNEQECIDFECFQSFAKALAYATRWER